MFAGTGLSEFQGNFNLTEATAEDVEGYIDGLKRHDKILWIGVPSDPTKWCEGRWEYTFWSRQESQREGVVEEDLLQGQNC